MIIMMKIIIASCARHCLQKLFYTIWQHSYLMKTEYQNVIAFVLQAKQYYYVS